MRILLDTHILLWALAEPRKLSREARALIEDRDNEALFSAASIWELAVKSQAGRIGFSVSPAEIAGKAVESGFDELAVRARHAAIVHQLPLHHRDPFDRLLLAQAISEPARFLTVDRTLAKYSELVHVL